MIGIVTNTFYLHYYPAETRSFEIGNMIIIAGAGISGAISGGYILDKYQTRIPTIGSKVMGGSALVALPFFFVAFIVQPVFWLSMVCYGFSFFFTAIWFGPGHAQLNNTFPSQY